MEPVLTFSNLMSVPTNPPSDHGLVPMGFNTHFAPSAASHPRPPASMLALVQPTNPIPDGYPSPIFISLDHTKPVPPSVFPSLSAVLSTMATPVYVTCISSARAACASRLYLAYNSSTPAHSVIASARANGEKWVDNANLVAWVRSTLAPFSPELIFRQLFEKESSTYTYVLGCPETKVGIIIDPVDSTVERDLKVTRELGLDIKYAINTHAHADHVTGTALFRTAEAEQGRKVVSVISEKSGAKADAKVKDGDVISFGGRSVSVRETPGHTNGCLTFVMDDLSIAFTGDTLLIRGCGRTDFQEGDAGTLYDSVHEKIFTLPSHCFVHPAHDYQGRTRSTVGEEIEFNPRLGKGNSKQDFIKIMGELNLSHPKMIDVALPKNMNCGV